VIAKLLVLILQQLTTSLIVQVAHFAKTRRVDNETDWVFLRMPWAGLGKKIKVDPGLKK